LHSPALIQSQFHINWQFTIEFVRYDTNRYCRTPNLVRCREHAKGFHVDKISERSELCFLRNCSDHVIGCEKKFHAGSTVLLSVAHQPAATLQSLRLSKKLNRVRDENISNFVLGSYRTSKSGRYAKLMVICEHGFCHARRILNPHSSNDKIHGSPSNLRFENTDFADSPGFELAELSPRGELGFNGEGD